MTRPPFLIIAAAACLSLAASEGHAQSHRKDRDHERARTALTRGEILPLTRILAAASARVPGDVIRVELEDEHGRWTYEVHVLDREGRVREIELNARTGEILRVEND